MEIARGAEATIYEEDSRVRKIRTPKSYRLPELDKKLIGKRTRREAKVLTRLQEKGIRVPKLISSDGPQLIMEKIEGKKLSICLEKQDYRAVCEKLGKMVRKMHDARIIHGDLTTSNVMYSDDLCIIDFGLSFFSQKIEDRAVDLHLLKQALESRHHKIYQDCFEAFSKGYDDPEVQKRLAKVELRGRYKHKR